MAVVKPIDILTSLRGNALQPKGCIPRGRYKVQVTKSPKFGWGVVGTNAENGRFSGPGVCLFGKLALPLHTQIFTAMNILLVVILLLVGVALLVAELFLIPGFGVAGIAGLAAVAGGVFCAYWYIGPLAGHIALCASVMLCAVAVYIFLRSRALDKMALRKNIDGRVDLLAASGLQAGDKGVTLSRLAPMGKVRIGSTEAEAKSAEAFIGENTPVEVVRLEGNTVVVKTIS